MASTMECTSCGGTTPTAGRICNHCGIDKTWDLRVYNRERKWKLIGFLLGCSSAFAIGPFGLALGLVGYLCGALYAKLTTGRRTTSTMAEVISHKFDSHPRTAEQIERDRQR